MAGVFYNVGVGPGDPELITVKAARLLSGCDCFAFPDSGGCGENIALKIALAAVPKLRDKPTISVSMPMTRDAAELSAAREAAASRISAELQRGQNVCFITLGDPSVYATGAYLCTMLQSAGHRTETVAGVPSFCAAAAALGVPLASAGEALHIIPASYPAVGEAMELSGTKVFMKAGETLPKLYELLQQKGLASGALAVQNCGMENERLGPLEQNTPADYFTLVIVK